MKIKMLKTTTGSRTGVLIESFQENEIYDVPPDLRRVFLELGVAEDVAPIEAVKNKMTSPKIKTPSPKNKK